VGIAETCSAALALTASLAQDLSGAQAIIAEGVESQCHNATIDRRMIATHRYFRSIAILLRSILRDDWLVPETAATHTDQIDEATLAMTRLIVSDNSGQAQATVVQEGIVCTVSRDRKKLGNF
jgi:hypothetical protein